MDGETLKVSTTTLKHRNNESCFSLKALRIKCKASVRAMMHSGVIRESTVLYTFRLSMFYMVLTLAIATHQPCGPFLHMLEKRLELGKKLVNYSGVLGAMFLGLKTQKRNSKILWDLPGLGLLSNKATRVESLIIIL